jgi:hypothetical protein
MPPLCSVIDSMSLISMAAAVLSGGEAHAFPQAVIEARETKSHCYAMG